MSVELAVREDTAALEADPVQYMAVVLNRAKEWLSEAQSIDEVRKNKAIAVGMESYIREKELASDAQLSATEMVRRCERRIGELVREGQREGTIRKAGDDTRVDLVGRTQLGPAEVVGVRHRSDLVPLYAMADVPAEEFEKAVGAARGDGNLSRANVVRKLKGDEPKKNKHHRVKGDPDYHKRHVDPERILRTLCHEMESMDTGLEHIDPASLDPDFVEECVTAIRAGWGRVNRHLRRISQ